MSALNSISIIGNLGADPVLRMTADNTPVCNLRVAVNKGDVVNWFNVTVWNEMATLTAVKMKKGMQVFVEGELNISQWDREVTAPTSGEVFTVKSDSYVIKAHDIFATTDMKSDIDNVPVDNIPEVSSDISN